METLLRAGAPHFGPTRPEFKPQPVDKLFPDTRLALPDFQHDPAGLLLCPTLLHVPPDVIAEFLSPEVRVAPGCRSESSAAPVPEASMNEDHGPPAREQDIWRASQFPDMKPKAQPHPVEYRTHADLGRRVALSNTYQHPAARVSIDDIGGRISRDSGP